MRTAKKSAKHNAELIKHNQELIIIKSEKYKKEHIANKKKCALLKRVRRTMWNLLNTTSYVVYKIKNFDSYFLAK
ncbi:hypothetical protein CBEIBR21_02880 [Clostridium beijerinckii]|uniref:Uncharacterized protein n=1 Tax=Clostridium beijerinckii TaxID=1520 RepID=A0A1S9NCB2_CLOBE|nr:hypothetical protein CBEIBR21_02880 [Clostridium beijerinckii]